MGQSQPEKCNKEGNPTVFKEVCVFASIIGDENGSKKVGSVHKGGRGALKEFFTR